MSDELHAQNVVFAYDPGQTVLDAVSVRLPAGRLAGIVGPNGSGKSTLLRVLAGILHPDTGQVRLDDRPLRRFGRLELARRLAFLPQDLAPVYNMTVREVVAQGRFPHTGMFGFLTHHDEEVIDACLDRTESSELGARSFDELSGGERRRVLISSILAQEARVVLLDEPTAALDIHHQSEVFELLAGLAREGLTVAVVTHDLNVAAQFCDTLILIREGAIMREGRPEDVLRQDVLREVYDADVLVTRHPVNESPMVVVARKKAGETK